MASPFDTAWAGSDAALGVEMGEAVSIGGATVADAVVSETGAGSKLGNLGVVNSGVSFTVHLSLAQIQALANTFPKGPLSMKGKPVTRGEFKGRVVQVTDLGGAGAELECGPVSDR